MKLIGIVGTNSTRSTNRRLLQFIQSHFSDQAEIELCEISDLPAFNEPEDRTAPAAVQALSEKIEAKRWGNHQYTRIRPLDPSGVKKHDRMAFLYDAAFDR